jgi:hypothetical protein
MATSKDDVHESALFALRKAGSRGLNARDLADAVVTDGACGEVPWRERQTLGLMIGSELTASGMATVDRRNRFHLTGTFVDSLVMHERE